MSDDLSFTEAGSTTPARDQGLGLGAVGGAEMPHLSLEEMFSGAATNRKSNKTIGEIATFFRECAVNAVSGAAPLYNFYELADEEFYCPVVVMVDKKIEGSIARAYVFFLEELSKEIPPITQQEGDRKILWPRYTADLFDETLKVMVKASILQRLPADGIRNVLDVAIESFCVIPKRVTTGIASSNEIAGFYDEAHFAMVSSRAFRQGRPSMPLTVSQLLSEKREVIADIRVAANSATTNPFGEYVHSDFRNTLRLRTKQQPNASLHGSQVDIVVAHADFYMDFAPLSQPVPKTIGGTVLTPRLIPYAVMTSATGIGTSTRTCDSLITQLLSLITLEGPLTNNRWRQIFTRGDDKTGKVNLKNLGYDPSPFPGDQNEPGPLPVVKQPVGNKSGQLTVWEVLDSYLVEGAMLIAIDVEHGSPMSWVQGLIASADPGSVSEAIITAELNYFTGGLYGQAINKLASEGKQLPIVVERAITHPSGHFVHTDNTVRSIAAIDYLTFLGACGGDMSQRRDFLDALTPGQCSHDAIVRRRNILAKYIPNVEFTGMKTRRFINPQWINVVNQILTSMKLSIQMTGMNAIDGSDGNFGMFGQTYGGLNQSGVFTTFGSVTGASSGLVDNPFGGSGGLGTLNIR